jgi:hypothetical protein
LDLDVAHDELPAWLPEFAQQVRGSALREEQGGTPRAAADGPRKQSLPTPNRHTRCVNETNVTFAGDGGRMLDQGGRRLSVREEAALHRILSAEASARRLLDELPDLRVAVRSTCCPSIAFVAGGPTREQPHGTLVEQLVAEAAWEARPDVEVLIFSRGGRLSSMEYVHYDTDTDVSHTEFPPADELQPRSRH